MSKQASRSIRAVKTLAERAFELEAQEKALTAEIHAKQRELHNLVIQRCAIAYEQRCGMASTLKKRQAVAADWGNLLKLEGSEGRAVTKARTKALAELHLMRAWLAWGGFSQIVVAFELSIQNRGELFWVRDGILEILPHLQPRVPGYKCLGISHAGAFSLRYFLLCAETGDHFKIVQAYQHRNDVLIFESKTLQEALEFVQKNFAR
jgi:hypothetical protein